MTKTIQNNASEKLLKYVHSASFLRSFCFEARPKTVNVFRLTLTCIENDSDPYAMRLGQKGVFSY